MTEASLDAFVQRLIDLEQEYNRLEDVYTCIL